MKIIFFNISALMLLFLILLSAIARKMTKGKANVTFLIAIAEVLIATVFGTFAIYYDNLGEGYVNVKWAMHAGYLFFHTLTAAFYLYYQISLTDTWHKLKHNLALSIAMIAPTVVLAALLLANCFTPILFTINDATVYTRGPAMIGTYLIAAYYMIFGIIYIFRHRKLFSMKWILTLYAPYPIILISIIVEFVYPYTVIELFFNALALLFVSSNIQRPEELIDAQTGLGNAVNHDSTCKKAFINRKPCRDILIKITNFTTLRDTLGVEQTGIMINRIASIVTKINKSSGLKAQCYYVGNGQFHYLVEEKHFGAIESCTEQLSESLNSVLLCSDGVEVMPSTTVCVIDLMKDMPDFDSFYSFTHDFYAETTDSKVIYASKLFEDKYYQILLNIDRIIEAALVEHRLEVYYQPIYSVESGRFNSAEALLRLKDPHFGFIPPDIFITAAEKSGAIHKIGEYVLDEVCAFIGSDDFSGLGVDYIEVNLSVAQCMQQGLSEQVYSILERHNVSSDKINLEITETAVSQSTEMLMKNLNAIVGGGISISLDDFGSGYSNIRRIAKLPVCIVKLDKEFVNDCRNTKSVIILEKTVHMLKALNLKIVVEGVETADMADRFKDMQCEYIQGYFYARPMPKTDYVAFLQSHNAIAA